MGTTKHTCRLVTVLCGSGQHSQRVCIPCAPSKTSCDDCRPKTVPDHTCGRSEEFVCKSGKHRWYQFPICYPKPKRCASCPLVRVRRKSRPVYVIKRRVFRGILQGIANVVEGFRDKSAYHWAVAIGEVDDPGAIRYELIRKFLDNTATFTALRARDKKGRFRHTSEEIGGSTWLTNKQIKLIVEQILDERPMYWRGTSDCQSFAVDLLMRIVDYPSPKLCHEDDKRAKLRWEEEMKWAEEEYDESEEEYDESEEEYDESEEEYDESEEESESD